MTDDLVGKIMTKFFGLRAKTYSYLIGLQQLQGLQQIAFKHLSDIDFRYFINFYKKCTAKHYYFFS